MCVKAKRICKISFEILRFVNYWWENINWKYVVCLLIRAKSQKRRKIILWCELSPIKNRIVGRKSVSYSFKLVANEKSKFTFYIITYNTNFKYWCVRNCPICQFVMSRNICLKHNIKSSNHNLKSCTPDVPLTLEMRNGIAEKWDIKRQSY